MPIERSSDLFQMSANDGPPHALLDRLAAANPRGNLPIGMKADHLAAAKHRLRLLGRARDKILHQNLIGECVAAEIVQCAFEIVGIAHEPDAAARGADRSLHDGGKSNGFAQLLRRCHDLRRRLRQFQSIEQPAEAGLAVRGAIIRKTRQREAGTAFDALLRPGKQKSLLMRRQQHIEFPLRQPLLDEGQITGGVVPQSGTTVKFPDQP